MICHLAVNRTHEILMGHRAQILCRRRRVHLYSLLHMVTVSSSSSSDNQHSQFASREAMARTGVLETEFTLHSSITRLNHSRLSHSSGWRADTTTRSSMQIPGVQKAQTQRHTRSSHSIPQSALGRHHPHTGRALGTVEHTQQQQLRIRESLKLNSRID